MSDSPAEGIAIIGMAGRFPGAANVGEFWRNLIAGSESISTFTDEELAASGIDIAALRRDGGHYTPARGVLEGAELFDAPFFSMTAKEAEVTDPQQRLFLEVAWHALENAGYDPDRAAGLIGIYAGVGINTYNLNHIRPRADLVDMVGEEMITLGNEKDYLATRVAYKLNLHGPALNVNTACSTALVAVGQACQALLHFQCDLALAGGVSVTFPQKRGFAHQEGGFASPDGHTRAFDAAAKGTVFSDGLGVIALKRLAEAIDDGDQIYAVVKGVGVNNDGSGKVGFTAPSVDGQAEAIALAHADAGFDPDTISYIECHGTATPIGDPIEVAALTQAFRMRTARKAFCAIGSVKSNIGHLGAAAGAAGLIKTALALKHKTLPPSLHYTAPNPKIDFAGSPFFVNAELSEWKPGRNPRRAGVSAFGFGGTNAHVAVEEAPALEPSGPSRDWQLLVLSAKSEAALDEATANLAAHFKANPETNLADAAYTLQVGRRQFDHRRILACRDIADAAAALEKRDPKRLFSRVHDADSAAPSVVFMFPGQGSQYVGMGADLYKTEPVFKEQIDRCAEILLPSLGLDLRNVLYPEPDRVKAAEELLLQTRITQPALFAIEYALATLWMSWGIKPAALTGHSLGEYVAACLAGVFTLEDALALVAQRGHLIQSMPRGSMLAVPMTESDLRQILPRTLSIAGVNGPAQCVVSGPSPDIDAFLATLTADGKTGRPLHTSHAFHSAMMEPVLQPFADCVRRVKRSEPKIPFLSNLTGTWISADDARDPQYWARHLRQAVRFADGVKKLLENESVVFLEVGPGTTLGSLVKFQAKKADNRAILSSLRHAREEQPDLAAMLTALGQLWERGVAVDWTAFRGEERRHRIALPGYPFQRERYWVERYVPSATAAVAAPVLTTTGPPPRQADIADWFYVPTWKRSELTAPATNDLLPTPLLEWLLFVPEDGVGEAVAKALAAQEENVTRVRVGTAYRKISDSLYAINPDRPEDYAALVADLAAADKLPQKIVHFWSVSNPEEGVDAIARADHAQSVGLHSVLNLVRALGEKNVTGQLDLDIVFNNAQAVTGEEMLMPEKATLIGAGKVIPQEYANIRCRCVGILIPEAGSRGEQRLVTQLLKEFSTPSAEPVVAYRAGYRWIKRYDPIRLEPAGRTSPRLKTRGVYLVTGGLGGVGLALAQSLAASVQARLVLIGRSAPPPREQWAEWIAAHGEDDATSARIRKIQTLESAGAECLVLAADVADRDAMELVIAAAKNRFGRIDGVIHAAGSPDHGGIIQRRTKEATDAILAAKVKGTLVLDELLAAEKLDFLVLCSTLGNVILGGKFGQVGYAAANEFLDAFAFAKKAEDGVYTVAINWDNWSDVGMAADIAREQTREGRRVRVLTAANSLSAAEGAEVFQRILNQDFAQVAVSVAELEARARSLTSESLYQSASTPAPAAATEAPATERHARPEVDSAYAAPTGDAETVLAGIWQELLGVESVGIDDNFFDLGGDSLLLMRVQVKIRQAFGADLSSAEMFQFPTISALAKRLSAHAVRPEAKTATPARPATPRPVAAATEAAAAKAAPAVARDTVKDDSHDIAIIGMAGRFPGAKNVDEYWSNLVNGVESFSTFTDEELAAAGFDVAEIRRNPNYVASRGIIENADAFDAAFFNFGAKEAEVTDPQQRLFLEAAWEALENAGYDAARLKNLAGVFAGMGTNTYYLNNLYSHPELVEQVGKMTITVGNEKDYVATRTAYKLNLKGPAVSTNTACSTSLVTVCLATQALLGRQCDLALAGGVYVSFPQKRASYFQEGGIYSPDGHCRPFDAHAAGTYFSDGLGVVVLKRLADAQRDGDQIYAVIKGAGFNNDGSDKVGFTAPGVQGQSEVITLAQAHAGVAPETISYIEAHGTATPLGDPIEIAALSQAFRAGTSRKNFCAIGSVKGNIGHLDAAAGVAGLIKTALALKHKKLPATLNFTAPNPKIDFANSPFYVNAKLTDWKAGATPRRAGVSAFGIGGTNAHVVLEEPPAPKPAALSRQAQLLVLSARTASALDAATARFLAHLKANPDLNLADAAYTLQVGRRVFPHRRMLVARDVPDAIQALETLDPKRVFTRQTDAKDCPVVFMFPGQGAQYVNMGADLYKTEPVFRAEVDRCAGILVPHLGLDIRDILFPAAEKALDAEARLIETRITQPALFVIEYGLAKLWMSWGIKPQVMMSHSLGEFVAACLAGVFSLEDALRIVAGRAKLVQEQPKGAMVAVRLPEAELVPLLPETLSIAALNSPALSVVAGPHEASEKFEAALKGRGIASRRLDTSHAFHSAMMDPVVEPFTALLENVRFREPAIPYVSNVTGRWITPAEAKDPHYWASHARQTVRFADGVGEILKDSQRVLLEVGPGRTLTTFANQHPDKSADRVVLSSILPSKDPDISDMLTALGRLWLAGKAIDWTGFYANEKRRRISLPTYPFERKRFWVEPLRSAAAPRPVTAAQAHGAIEGFDSPADTRASAPVAVDSAAPRRERLVEALRELFHTISGLAVADLTPAVSFMELGFDSLSLAQASHAMEKKFGVRIAFRQMLEELTTINDVAAFLDGKLPADALTAPAAPSAEPKAPAAAPAAAATPTLDTLQAQVLTLTKELDDLRRSLGTAAPAPGEASRPAHEFPLSEAQKEVWISSQVNHDASRAFNQVFVVDLPERLGPPAIGEILQQLVDRHDALRTTFSEDGAMQTVATNVKFEMPVRDLSALGAEEQKREVAAALSHEAHFVFNFTRGPLLRVQLLQLSGGRGTLIFNAHHIILDGWSIGALMREFEQLYRARERGETASLEPAMQYREYVAWRNAPAQQALAQADEAYWLDRFATIPNDIELPTDRPRPPIKTFLSAQRELVLEPAFYAALKETAAAHDCTLYVFLVACLKAWMYRLTGREDLVVGIPVAGQLTVTNRTGNRWLIGHCVSALPLRSDCPGARSFADHLRNIKALMLDAQEHQSVSVGTLVRQLHLRPDPSRPPLIPIAFNLGRTSRQIQLEGAKFYLPAKEYTFFDLHFEGSDSGKDLHLECRYNPDLYDDARIERMLQHFKTLVSAAVADPARALQDLPLLTDTERQHILVDWNRTETPFRDTSTAHELIEEHAIRAPDADAVIFGPQKLTYQELNSRANQLARHLKKLGVGPETPVGLSMERSPEMIIALLGILKAGGAYLPLDPAYPADRLAFMIEDSGIKLILTQQELQPKLPAGQAKFLCLDSEWKTIARESNATVPTTVKPANLAYIIYTSGSTGRPKGVLLQHHGLCNLIRVHHDQLGIRPGHRVLQFASISFDASVWEIFSALANGAALVLARPEQLLPGPGLLKLLRDQLVNVVTLPPTVLNAIAEQELPALRTVISAGEACTLEMAKRWGRGRRFINAYGPTESTVCATMQVIGPDETKLTIGRPLANFQVYILDERLQPVPIGVEGELHIGGLGLARGYHNRPELTAEKFVTDPFSSDPAARLYKTGDLARYTAEGTIEYLGRLDHQVKIRGFRIELGEIEQVLNQYPGMSTNVVVAREDIPGDKRLVAYVVGDTLEPSGLRDYLRAKLPDYMVPAAFVPLPALPLTPNGKVDRKALPRPDFESGAGKGGFVAPSTPTENTIAEIWRQLLGLKQVSINDSFFELGGHSILAVRLINQMSKALDFQVSIPMFFQNPTVGKLANLCDEVKSGKKGRDMSEQNVVSTTARAATQAEGTSLPLSEPQREIWLGCLASEDASRSFNQIFALHLPDRLDEDALAGILQQLVDRHDSLRTSFAPDGATQIIARTAQIELPTRDLSTWTEAEQEQALARELAKEQQFAFDLARGPLFHAQLLKLSGGRRVLIVNAHHIVLDGWSFDVLLREFGQLYQARISGTPAQLEPAMQYQEYMAWLESSRQQSATEQAEAYWFKKFATLPTDLELATDHPRPSVRTYRAAQREFRIDPAVYQSLKEVAKAHECTVYAYLLAALNAWMFRLTGQDDIVVGVPAAGQLNVTDTAGSKSLIGHCVGTLPVRSLCQGDVSFSTYVKSVNSQLLEAIEHQSITLGTLVRKLHVRTDLSRTPLTPVVFNFHHTSRLLYVPGSRVVIPPKEFTFFDLNIEAADSGNDVLFAWRYNSDLFDDLRIERMVRQFQTLLTAAVTKPASKLCDLPLLTEAVRRQILVEWNRTEVNYPMDRHIHEVIEAQAARTPDAIAVAFESQTLTYRELNARANQLARHLQKLGVQRDTLVGICLERSLEMVVGLLGILKAGGAYVPLDPEYPKQRLAFMLEDSDVGLLLTQAHLAETLPSSNAKILRLDADWPTIATGSDTNFPSGAGPKDLAYMIYTSGSTGQPKGAMNTHEGILNRLLWMQEAYQLTSADNVLQKTPFSFDVSVWEFFWPLMMGSRLVVARPGGHRDPAYLAQLIADEKITTLHFVPSMLQLFLAQDGLESSCASIKRVICSGEALPLELQRRFFATLNAELHNLYGPTEAAVDVTYWACRRNSTLSTVPIGRPIANMQIYILDPRLQPVPVGAAGELHIGGIGLARGYHRRPELTAEKFIPNPFSSEPGARLYKTGDLARFLPDGNVEYLGRLDHQIKIRGLRVELGEIEEALNQYPGIDASVVMAREDQPGDVRLIAYLVHAPDAVSVAQLREQLGARLPDYMVPAAFVRLDSLPLSPNGKVDRKLLPKPDFEAAADRSKFVAPASSTEIALARIWSEVLGIKQVGATDNFFTLGGHSMLAVRLIGRIKKAMGFDLSIPAFFQNPTIRQLAAVHDRGDHSRGNGTARRDDLSRLIPFQPKGDRPPLFFLHGDWAGGGLYCGHVARHLGEKQPFYALPPYHSGKNEILPLEEMVDHHLAVMREHTPHGPYFLGGYCVGATIAVEMARRLIAEGEEVLHLLLLDPPHGRAPSLPIMWNMVQRLGDVLKWDLHKRIRFYDRYCVSAIRWLRSTPKGKVEAIKRRLGIKTASDAMIMGWEGAGDEPDILQGLDFAVYFLSSCLHTVEPISVPTTVYCPTETAYSFSREKRVNEVFPVVSIEMVPGTHHTCISRYAPVLAERMKKALATGRPTGQPPGQAGVTSSA